jgi:hypothetical protein
VRCATFEVRHLANLQQTTVQMSSRFPWACCRQNDAGVVAQKRGQSSVAFDHLTEAIRLHPQCAAYHANRCGLTATTHAYNHISKQAMCTPIVVKALRCEACVGVLPPLRT